MPVPELRPYDIMRKTCCAIVIFIAIAPFAQAGGVGNRTPSESTTYLDDQTGATVTRLTTSPAQDDKVYQTHPNWIADGSHIIFNSDRTGTTELFALEEATGDICQLTDGDSGAIVVSRDNDLMYLVRDNAVFAIDLQTLLADSKSRAMKPAAAYRRHIADVPPNCHLSGTYTEDADGNSLYFGLVDGSGQSTIQKLDIGARRFTKVLDVPFKLGHCQAHPTKSGIISYCHETGGDAPQRMWITHADGTGNRPFYTETYDEWVTHEVWWTEDRMLFAIWPKDETMKQRPYGIASVSLTDFTHTFHDQFPYWHVCGTPDGKYAIGDTFQGELFLVDITTGKRTLLTQGHRPPGAKSHQHQSLSPDGKRVLFVSSKFGNWDLMSVDLPTTKGN
ncbi:MAG: oligogalacturonate lyase family protein [Pirellulales bacterium]